MRTRTTSLRTRHRYFSRYWYERCTSSGGQYQHTIFERAILPEYRLRTFIIQRNSIHLRRWQRLFRSRLLVYPAQNFLQTLQQQSNPDVRFWNCPTVDITERETRTNINRNCRRSSIQRCGTSDNSIQCSTSTQHVVYQRSEKKGVLHQFGSGNVEKFNDSKGFIERSNDFETNSYSSHSSSSIELLENNSTFGTSLYDNSSNVEDDNDFCISKTSMFTNTSNFTYENDVKSSTSILNCSMDVRKDFSSTSCGVNISKHEFTSPGDESLSTIQLDISIPNLELHGRNGKKKDSCSNVVRSSTDRLDKGTLLHIDARMPNNISSDRLSGVLEFKDLNLQLSPSESTTTQFSENISSVESCDEHLQISGRKYHSNSSSNGTSKTSLRWRPYDREKYSTSNTKRHQSRYVRSQVSGSSYASYQEKNSGLW